MTEIILTFHTSALIFLILYVIRIEVVYSMHDKIIDAIFDRTSYYLEQRNIEEINRVHFSDMESYNDTFRRWWGLVLQAHSPKRKVRTNQAVY